jgi:hypothetical protein
MNNEITSLSQRIAEVMTELKATPVVKDKFWIVEDGEKKVATIQAVEEGGYVYVHDNHRERFPSVKILQKKYNIEFEKPTRLKKEKLTEYSVYGWPTSHQPFNPLYDVARKLPIYTKTSKSKSYFCAGYYIVKFANNWAKAYCPKLITLQRYEFLGPFATREEMTEQARLLND